MNKNLDSAHTIQPAARAKITWQRILLTVIAFAMLLTIVGFLAAGKSGAEKTVTRLVQPLGIGWLSLAAWCWQCTWLNGFRSAVPQWLVWFALTLVTTAPLSDWCVYKIESSVESYRPERDGQLAVVVVLGGCTRQGPWRAELAETSDHVMYAAQLYLQHYTQRLITTGDATPGVSRDLSSPREQTLEIWTQLKIPRDAIGSLEGQNTYQELQSLKKIYHEFQGQRVGLLTSALHLPRAMRLAKAQGLDVVPLAAEHHFASAPLHFVDLIPSAEPLYRLSACQREFMAQFVAR